MKKTLMAVIVGCSVIACPILYFTVGPALSQSQLETLRILAIIAACSGLYCFIVGEVTHNNSQMDKLWSILPELYVWIMTFRSGFKPRLLIMAVLATVWGIRLTRNFARKGAYSWKFWTGVEDYRWSILRAKKEFQPHIKWVIFNFLFISVYQNALVLMTTFPALVILDTDVPLNALDIVAAVLMLAAICYEAVADSQQWKFQSKKKEMLRTGKKLEELPAPYNKGFNTTGLWNHSRHPNYFAEQSTWVCFYLFSVAAGIGVFNWSIIGALLLIVLFLGSSTMGEEISASKYPEYREYQKRVSRYFYWKKYE